MELGNIDILFFGSYAFFFSIFFVNLGAIIDLKTIKDLFIKPIEISIYLFCNILFVPLWCYFNGWMLLSDDIELHYGIFIIGISATGAAPLCWTLILKGNINLSLAIYLANLVIACGSAISWTLTLGKTIYYNENTEFPNIMFVVDAAFTFIALLFGLLLQRICPCNKKFSHIILIGTSLIYIIGSMGLGIWQNYDLFMFLPSDIQWKIFLAGFLIPTVTYIIAFSISKAFKLKFQDCHTVAFGSFGYSACATIIIYANQIHPRYELSYVLYTAVFLMMPIPLVCHYLFYKIKSRLPEINKIPFFMRRRQ